MLEKTVDVGDRGAAAAGYLQAWLRFCAAFGLRGVFNFGPTGRQSSVADDAARRRDRGGRPVSGRVIVVGGGIVGCATAYFAAQAGLDVVLLEREHCGYGASGRNPGFVWLHCRNPGFALEISRAGRLLYERLLIELPGGFEFRAKGGLIYFTTDEQGAVMAEFAAARQADGLPVELIDGAEVRKLVPPIRPDVLGASFCAEDAQINTPAVVRALVAGARQEGAAIREGVTVRGIVRSGDRVVGVDTDAGRLDADAVVVAAGAWSRALLQPAGIELPVGGERLQVIATEPLPPQIEPLVYGPLAAKQYALFRNLPSWDAADSDEARRRVIIDQVASLTDTSAMVWHQRLALTPWRHE